MTRLRSLLWPLSVLYGAVVRLRIGAYRSGLLRPKRLNALVISVGNLTVGGTGKTPLVAWLAEQFSAAGQKTAILSRGYRPLAPRARAMDPGLREGWNDEAALLNNRLKGSVEMGVSADRFAKGKELENRGIACFLLDDGFQHVQLDRDVDIVLLDATRPFGGGQLLPAGRLREPVSALRRADIIVITRAEHSPAIEARVRRFTPAPIFYGQTGLLGIETYSAPLGRSGPSDPVRKGYYAFCGIGNPQAFFADLRRWGIALAGQAVFRDHPAYTERDISHLEARAAVCGADALLCTEKDTYDLLPLHSERMPILFCKIALRFTDPEGIWRAIVSAAEGKRGKVFL